MALLYVFILLCRLGELFMSLLIVFNVSNEILLVCLPQHFLNCFTPDFFSLTIFLILVSFSGENS